MSETRDLRTALRDANWDDLLPRLAAYAKWRLRRAGWPDGQDTEPGAMSVQEAVNKAIQRCLQGDRRWKDQAAIDLETLLKGVISSVVSSERKAVRRKRTDANPDAADALADESPSAETFLAEAGRSEVLAAALACVEGDEALESLYLAITVYGATSREELASALGWPEDEVSKQRVKLQRRLIAQFPTAFAKLKNKRKTE